MKAGTGQLGQNSQNRSVRTSQPDMSTTTGRLGQGQRGEDGQNMTLTTEQLRQDKRDKITGTGQPGQVNRDRTTGEDNRGTTQDRTAGAG
jgi:hypothetical protein